MKALVDQKGKFERQNRAKLILNQLEERHKEDGECRREERELEDNFTKRNKEKEYIKIGAYNINGIKGNSMKVELLAEHDKAEGYNIIGIIETNIEKQEGKWINTRKYYL